MLLFRFVFPLSFCSLLPQGRGTSSLFRVGTHKLLRNNSVRRKTTGMKALKYNEAVIFQCFYPVEHCTSCKSPIDQHSVMCHVLYLAVIIPFVILKAVSPPTLLFPCLKFSWAVSIGTGTTVIFNRYVVSLLNRDRSN